MALVHVKRAYQQIANADGDTQDRINKILAFESALAKMPGAQVGDCDLCPLTNHFAPGVYLRECFIPAGTYLTGRIHLHEHFCILLSGTVHIADETGASEVTGPRLFLSKPRTKRAIRALTDTLFITIHPNPDDKTDIDELENEIAVWTYEEYDQRQKLLPQEVST